MASYQLSSKRGGWDGPLRIKLEVNRLTLINSFAQAAPVGKHPHDQISGKYTDKRVKYPRTGGRLRDFVGGKGIGKWNVFYNRDGSLDRASISVFLPYAAIIEHGGTIPPVYPVYGLRYTKGGKARYRARIMHFAGSGGDMYTMGRKGYTIQAQNYVERGFNDYCNKTANAGGLKVGWIDGGNAAYGGIH